MAVSNIQGISSARSRAIYVELGKGTKYSENVRNDTTREAFGMSKGDLGSLDDFVTHCETVAAANPKRKYQAYSLIVSFPAEEMDKDSREDVQRALVHGYELSKRLFPNSYCYVVAHQDSNGGMLHDHIIVCNQDEVSGNAIKGHTLAGIVHKVNDELCIEEGLSSLGQQRQTQDAKTTWAEQRKSEPEKSFKRVIGDAVDGAKRRANSLEEFMQNLDEAGVEVKEKASTDKKTGERHSGWTYYMMDETGPKRRKRRMKAANLADDLTKDDVETYFEKVQTTRQDAKDSIEERYAAIHAAVERDVTAKKALQEAEEARMSRFETPDDKIPDEEKETQEKAPEEPQKASQAEPQRERTFFDDYRVDSGDVKDALGAVKTAYERKPDFDASDSTYRDIRRGWKESDSVMERLQAEVDRRREAFYQSKANLNAIGRVGSSFSALSRIFSAMSREMANPSDRTASEMLGRLMAMLWQMEQERIERERREALERDLYEKRGAMWDAEKRLKAANSAVTNENKRCMTGRRSGIADTYRQYQASKAEKDDRGYGE